MQTSRGGLIVIDGTDGSGKATQVKILTDRLQQEGVAIASFDFPQYGKKSSGLVENYLNGAYGTADAVGAYRASLFYACDRYDASFAIRKALNEGKVIVTNRYVSANLGHQMAKIANTQERKKFRDWLYDVEYGIFDIPKPDLQIMLHVTPEISQKLVDDIGHRDYVGGVKRDIHEADIHHLRKAEQAYKEIAQLPGFTLIECVENGEIFSREIIAERIWTVVAPTLGL